jgi:dolichol-phosphate mannosyltransferase
LARSYEFIIEMDCDFSHNPDDLPRLLECCRRGTDVTIGSRYVKNGGVKNWPRNRILISKIASKYVRLITWMPVHDTTAGFICYRRKALESINLSKIRFMGYAFQIEMKFAAWKLGFRLEEVPIIFTDRTEGVSKMSGGIVNEAAWGVIRMLISSWFSSYRLKPS